MYFTKETDYAVRITRYLAAQQNRMPAKDIAEHTDVTLRFALKILNKLVGAGLVTSYKGKTGGYELAAPPAQIDLRQIVETIEGPVGFGCQPEMLYDLRRIGFLITSLGWNEKNALAGSHVTGGGLTDQGREFVKEAQRVGMLIDVSHLSDEGFWDLMDITQAPIVATHSNSRNVWESSRNLMDDMFLEICNTGGVAGFNQYADFVGQNPDLDTACDHILHFLELDPEGRHIALGGDLDGCDVLVEGFQDVGDYPKLAQRLLARGAGEEIVSNIFWNNALRVIGCADCRK